MCLLTIVDKQEKILPITELKQVEHMTAIALTMKIPNMGKFSALAGNMLVNVMPA